MIISVGYRVKSRRGVEFRRWANDILKQYILNGYAINEKRLIALEKTVDIQTKMLACTLEVEEEDILKAVSLYTGGTDVVGSNMTIKRLKNQKEINQYTELHMMNVAPW